MRPDCGAFLRDNPGGRTVMLRAARYSERPCRELCVSRKYCHNATTCCRKASDDWWKSEDFANKILFRKECSEVKWYAANYYS